MFSPHARKRFGQNFLRDHHVIAEIVAAIAPQATEHLVEIGPGDGALTKVILPLVNNLDAIELDRDLIPILKNNCAELGELNVYQHDALQFDFAKLVTDERKLRIYGNLPYNISTPLLFHLFENINFIQDMHFMLQKEVVQRMVAFTNTEHYGRLSVMVQYFCQPYLLFKVGRMAFSPPPQVESAIVRLIPHAKPVWIANDITQFTAVVRQAFSQRRKMIRNSLKELVTSQELQQLNIEPDQRPEQIGLADYVKIANYLS